MFIYTVKASRVKFFALMICSMAILLTLAAVIPVNDKGESVAAVSYNYSNVKTNEDIVQFLEGFGYEVNPEPIETAEVTVPGKFDSVYQRYNDIQRAQGLNLKKFAGKTVKRYSYEIIGYDDASDCAMANILIFNGSIVGGDISRSGENAFIHGFKKPTES